MCLLCLKILIFLNPFSYQFHHHFMSSFFIQKCFEQLFSTYSNRVYIFWQNEISAKVARQMLVKLTRVFSTKNLSFFARNNKLDRSQRFSTSSFSVSFDQRILRCHIPFTKHTFLSCTFFNMF